jgi:hypothetical protein
MKSIIVLIKIFLQIKKFGDQKDLIILQKDLVILQRTKL